MNKKSAVIKKQYLLNDVVKNKKALAPVIAMSLLIVVTVVALVGFQNWYGNYQTITLADVNTKSSSTSGKVEIELIDGNYVYVMNNENNNITYSNVIVNGESCNINDELESGINEVDISGCLSDAGVNEVILITADTVVKEKLYVKELEVVIPPTRAEIYRDLILSENPQSYWQLDETSGTTANDYFGLKNGVNTNPTIGDSGAINDSLAYSFVDASEFITIPLFNHTNSTGFTLEYWFKTTEESYQLLMGQWTAAWTASHIGDSFASSISGGGCGVYPVYGVSFSIAFGAEPRVRFSSADSLSDGEWHHFVGSFHGGVRQDVYVDGVLSNGVLHTTSCQVRTVPPTMNLVTKDFVIGNILGSIDELAIYNYALNDSQVLKHYNVGIGIE